MESEKLERLLRTVNPARRLFLKKFVLGTTFAVPIIASYSLKDLAYAAAPCTETVLVTKTVTTGVTVTITMTPPVTLTTMTVT